MENFIKKFLISILVLASIIIPYTLLMLLYNNMYHGNLNTQPWIPPTVISTVTPFSTLTPAIPATISPTTAEASALNCIHSINYWSEHSEDWPDSISVGSKTNTKEEEIALYLAPVKDLNDYLFIQMTTAYLNHMDGSLPDDVEKIISQAAKWLLDHPSGSAIKDSDRQAGNYLGVTLSNYNNGKVRSDLCANEPTSSAFTEAAPPTMTITSTITLTRLTTHVSTKTSTQEPPKPPPPAAPSSTNTRPPAQPTATHNTQKTDTPVPLPTQAPPPPSSPTPIILPTPAPA